jgi:RNase H-fold protein (predicted Holliday junction resolvase)
MLHSTIFRYIQQYQPLEVIVGIPKNAAYFWQIHEESSKYIKYDLRTTKVTYFFMTSDFSKDPVLEARTLAARTGIVFLKASL